MTGLGTALSPFDDHQHGPAVGAGNDALFGDGQDVAAFFRDDPDVQELARLESRARRERGPDEHRIGLGVDVLADDDQLSGGRLPLRPVRPAGRA